MGIICYGREGGEETGIHILFNDPQLTRSRKILMNMGLRQVPVRRRFLQAIAEFLCSPPESDENFGGSIFFSRRQGVMKAVFCSQSTRFESIWTTTMRQSYYGTGSNTSCKVNGLTAMNSYYRCVPTRPQHPYLVIMGECHDKATQQLIL